MQRGNEEDDSVSSMYVSVLGGVFSDEGGERDRKIVDEIVNIDNQRTGGNRRGRR